jgi:hypothetical protein
MCGSTDIGQGSDSILAYIVAKCSASIPFDIRVVTADTDLTPVDLGSYSSRVTLMTGNAAIQAAERARELLVMAVAEKLGVPIENLSLAERRVFDVENPERRRHVRRSGRAGGIEVWHDRHRRLLFAAAFAGQVQRRGRRTIAGLQLLSGDRRSRCRSVTRALSCRARLDRARHRQVDQSDAGDGPGRRQRLHGTRRSADGRDGLSRRIATSCTSFPRCSNTRARRRWRCATSRLT